VSGRLKALVQMDLECSHARIEIRGSVDARNVQALYVVAKRTNAIMPGLDIVLDLKRATVLPEVMDQFLQYAEARQLPFRIDPAQSECRLSVSASSTPGQTPSSLALAA
jgi:hypothetical protein